MKKPNPFYILSLCLLLLSLAAVPSDAAGLNSPLQETEIEKEFMEISQVELILRVFHNGQSVKNLTAADFTLAENGENRDITSFTQIDRKLETIHRLGIEGDASDSLNALPRRLFILCFLFSEPDKNLDIAMDRFFHRVYSDGDYVLALCGDRFFKITSAAEIPQILPELKNTIRQSAENLLREKERLSANMDRLFRDFENRIRELGRSVLSGSHRQSSAPADQIRNLLSQLFSTYKTFWDEYKFKRIAMSPDTLIKLARSIKPLPFEKWGLVFYQSETFPRLNPESLFPENPDDMKNFMEVQRQFQALSSEMLRPEPNHLIEPLRIAFVDSGATFHLIQSTPETLAKMDSQFLKRDKIFSDSENIFTQLALATGGTIIGKGNPQDALTHILTKEDTFYRLTYAPRNIPQKDRAVVITGKNKKNLLLYNGAVVIYKANEIKLDNVRFTFPSLEFSLSHYQQLFDGEKLSGDIRLRVAAIDTNGGMTDFLRDFKPTDNAITASMNLNFPKGGQYSLIVEALDIQTGRKAVYSEKINVPKTGADISPLISEQPSQQEMIDSKDILGAILKKTAAYCDRLRQTTFYFTCREKINDYYQVEGKEIKNDDYLHNYQIVLEENGRMRESRTPPDRGKNKKSKKKQSSPGDDDYFILTNFYSQYPFLLPADIMGRESAGFYHYRLLAREKVGEADTYKISVEPKSEKAIINHGLAWVDCGDGSVVRISLNPRALKGFQALESRAREKERRITLTDTHWYEAVRHNIRFPSRTEIAEEQFDAAALQSDAFPLESSKTTFIYEDYRFFSVNSDVVESAHN